jgi:transposase
MALQVDKRYEIVFLSHHAMGPQLGVKAVAKTAKCAKSTVQYWLNRWKESKELSDLKRSGRPCVTTEKVDQRIDDLVSSENIATTRDIQNILKRQKVQIS